MTRRPAVIIASEKVPCPRPECLAPAGRRCRKPDGRPCPYSHSSRLAAAERAGYLPLKAAKP